MLINNFNQFICKIHQIIKLLRTNLRRVLLQIKLQKDTTAQNYHYHYNHPNYFDKLCVLYGSDKGFLELIPLNQNELKPHTYSTVYHGLFNHCRETINLVFEFGIGTNDININSNMGTCARPGASLRVFKDYFPKAKIYGADIDDKILFIEERILTFKVNQLDSLLMQKMWSNINKIDFDLIIDDGLHSYESQLNTFLNSFEKLRNGGIYIIEDIHFSYLRNLTDRLKKYNPEVIILQKKYNNKYNIKNSNIILIRKS